MNKLLVIAVLFLSVLTAGNSFASSMTCKTNAIIQKIYVGEVNQGYGADGGNAVYIQFSGDSRTYPLNYKFNLNDKQGAAILATLNSAMIMRLPVTILDHHGNNCDDFDEAQISRD